MARHCPSLSMLITCKVLHNNNNNKGHNMDMTQQRRLHGNQSDGEQRGWMQRRGTPSVGGSARPPRWQGSWAPASQSWCHVLLSCLLLDERRKHGQDIKHTLIVVNIHLKTTRIQHALHGSALPFLPWQNCEQVFMLCWLHECLCAWPSLQCHKPVTQCTNMHMHDICPQHTSENILGILWAGVGGCHAICASDGHFGIHVCQQAFQWQSTIEKPALSMWWGLIQVLLLLHLMHNAFPSEKKKNWDCNVASCLHTHELCSNC